MAKQDKVGVWNNTTKVLATVATLLLMAFGLGANVTGHKEEVKANTTKNEEQDTKLESLDVADEQLVVVDQQMKESLIRQESNQEFFRESLIRIEKKLDQ